MKVGVACVCISPDRSIWMAGFGDRDRPSEGAYQELFVKALALQDEKGKRAVIITADFLGYKAELSEAILRQVQEQFGLPPDAMLLNASHTHCGPAVLQGYADPGGEPTYAQTLTAKTVEAIGKALDDLEPARLWQGQGCCTLAVNRRRPLPNNPNRVSPSLLPNPQGAMDADVPVLKVVRADGSTKAVLFLYACHPTTIAGYLLGGDYAGFAQKFVETELPGATALFLQGCGGDIKPRNVDGEGRFKYEPLAAAEGFGRELAQAVLTTLAGTLAEVDGEIKTSWDTQELPAQELPSREGWEAQARRDDGSGRKARKVLEMLDAGQEPPRSYPHTAQVLTIGRSEPNGDGNALTLIGMSGEMCVDYALRLKREIGDEVWVSGYCYDVSVYIPSARMIPQGGYEVEGWLLWGELPTPFKPEIEEKIVGKVHALLDAGR